MLVHMLHPHHYETMTPGLSRLSFKFPVHLVLILVSDDRGIYPSLSSLPRQVHLQAPSMLIFNVSYFSLDHIDHVSTQNFYLWLCHSQFHESFRAG
jgi:hypothetical protein